MFLALRDGGAMLNGAPIGVSPGATLAGARLAGPKRYLDRLSAITPGDIGPTQSAFAGT